MLISNSDMQAILKAELEFNKVNYPIEFIMAQNLSSKIEAYCSRFFEQDSYKQKFTVTDVESMEFWLKATPIKKISSVKINDVLASSDSYKQTKYGVLFSSKMNVFDTVEIKYTGGYEDIPEEIQYAFIIQFNHLLSKLSKPGSSSEKRGNEGYSYSKAYMLLDEVKDTLDPYKNYLISGL